VHVGITLGILFLFFLTGLWFLKSDASNEQEAYLIRTIINNKQRQIRPASLLGKVFIVGQFAYLVNFAAGFLQKKHKHGT
jgi:hypothetical protein